MPKSSSLRAHQAPTDANLDPHPRSCWDFARFRKAEPEPVERRKLRLSLFGQVRAKDGAIVAVKPIRAFARHFTVASEVRGNTKKQTRKEQTRIRTQRSGIPLPGTG
jgi:hypothetical protein